MVGKFDHIDRNIHATYFSVVEPLQLEHLRTVHGGLLKEKAHAISSLEYYIICTMAWEFDESL